MKKIFTLVLGVVVSLSAMATTFTFTSSDAVSQTKDGITVTLSKGSGNNDPFFSSAEEMRLYANNTITVSGANLTDITMEFSKQGSKDYASLSASVGSLSSGGNSTSKTDVKTDKWTGSANSVTFTLGSTGQRIIYQLVVNGTGSESGNPSTPTDPTEPETPSTLDPNYTYAEPTVVDKAPSTVQGDSYWFIQNNIMVSCTKGATNDSYFSAHAGFDMTFTATKAIKGISIKGFVKKDFTASVDHGKISYLSPDDDTEGDPVVVITDVNSKSVTISCVKQLRCYNVEVYFEENPEGTVSGGIASSTVDLTFDSGEGVYESEYVDWIGEENYSIFLYNAASPVYPYLALDIYPESKDVLTGTYKMTDYSLGDYSYYLYGESDEDITWANNGEVTITKTGDVYSIAGYLICDNQVRYNFSFTGKLPIYLDTDYYYDDDEDDDDDGELDGVTEVVNDSNTTLDVDAPMYDTTGRRVGANYRGIVIQNGRKYMVR